MHQIPAPSTDWAERIEPDESERFARYAKFFAELQARRNARWGVGRTLHRKQLAAAQGTLEVLDGLPAWARHGLFEQPGHYETWVRLSNGGMDRQADRVPDIRGLALRVFGVHGPSALGDGPARSQDFTLINQEVFSFSRSAEFIDFVEAASRGGGALVRYLFKRYGLLGGVKQLVKTARTMGRPFGGFASQPLYGTLPIAVGPYAARVRLVPAPANGAPQPGARDDWGRDFAGRLRKDPLHWDLQLQYFTSEALTPIENAAVAWPTPFATVARLMLPQQDLDAPPARELAERIESSVFDPWQALAAHRPLGEVQRARKVVYFQSQKGRGAT